MVQLFVRGPGGRPGRRGEVSAQPDCRPMVLSGDDPAHQFSGAVVIGAVAQAAGQLPMSKSAVLFLKTGLCGGFTTFSTFSLETVELLEQGRWAAGGGYILASVGLCLAGVLLGRALVWKIL